MDDQPALNPQDEAVVEEAVRSSRHASRAEVMGDRLQLVSEREEWLAAVSAGVQRGLDDVKAGRVVDLDVGIQQVLRSIRGKAAGVNRASLGRKRSRRRA